MHPEEQPHPGTQTETNSQPSAEDLLGQRNAPLDDQEAQLWLNVDRTQHDAKSPESGLVQASYNYLDSRLGRGEAMAAPSEQDLDPYVRQAVEAVAAALRDPEITRRVIYQPGERRPEDAGALRIEEIADYVEAFKENPNGDLAEQELRRASLDIAMGMVTAQFAETHPDAAAREDEDFRPDADVLSSYLRDPENVSRHEREFIEQTEARIEDVENIRRHPAEAREYIADGLGGTPANPDTRTQEERVEDARENLERVINPSPAAEQSEARPDNVVPLDDYRRERVRPRSAPERESEAQQAAKIAAELPKLERALIELQATLRQLESQDEKLQQRLARAERRGRDTTSLRQQLSETQAGKRDIARQYNDIDRYRQAQSALHDRLMRSQSPAA